MTFLILAVVCSTINHLLFKVFARYKVDLLSVIVVNYAVCVIIGYSSTTEPVFQNFSFTRGWHPFSLLQGILLAVCFYLIGKTTAKHGVATAAIATRLSIAIPTGAAFLLYGDIVSVPKITGILAAFFALYLSCMKPKEYSGSDKSLSILPVALFMVFGLHSTLIKFVQERFLGASSYHSYVMASFLSAFMVSGMVLAWRFIKKKQEFRWKELLSGLALGCANYGAIYFLVRVLSVPGWQSSQVFPTISILVVITSTLGALAFFKERPGWRMTGALLIGVGAIVLVNLR